jgi:hypothetical protein
MKIGQKIAFVRGNGSPLFSRETAMVSAWLISGGKLASNKALVDYVEEVEAAPVRSYVWSIDGSVACMFGSESLEFAEFRKRFLDDDWVRANADHPISYLRAQSDQLLGFQQTIKARKPALLVRKRNRFAIIPADAPPATRKSLLQNL